jgi:hypothetical protein
MRAIVPFVLISMVGTTVIADEAEPKWLQEARAREGVLGEVTAIVSEDKWFRAKIPGKVTDKIEFTEGSYTVNVSVGSATIACEVLREDADAALLIRNAAEISFEQLGKANGKIEAREVEKAFVGAAGSNAYLATQWVYRVENKGEKLLGGLKQFVSVTDAGVVYCAHDELGYTQSFLAVARALAESIENEQSKAKTPYYREISTVHFDGVPAGVTKFSLTRDADGDTQAMVIGSMLLQVSPGKLTTQDSAEVQWIRPDGTLINASQSKVEDGTLTENATLKLDATNKWRAEGDLRGKKFSATIDGSAPNTILQQAYARRELLGQEKAVGAEVAGSIWTSGDLTRFVPIKATVLKALDAERFSVREEMGPVAIDAVIEKSSGMMTNGSIAMGPRTMTIERVYKQGSF